MSYCICVTCKAVIRDHDDVTGMNPQPLGLPEHGCADPRGSMIWNNGFNFWDDNKLAFRRWPDGAEPVAVYGPWWLPEVQR